MWQRKLRDPGVRIITARKKNFRSVNEFFDAVSEAAVGSSTAAMSLDREKSRIINSCARGVRDRRPVKTISPAELHVCPVLLIGWLCQSEAVEATSSYSAASHCYTIIRVKEKRALGPIADVPEMPHCPAGKVP